MENKKNQYAEWFVLLSSIVAFAAGILEIGHYWGAFSKQSFGIDFRVAIAVFTDSLNILILIVFYLIIRPTELKMTDEGLHRLSNVLKIDDNDAKYNTERVNQLVKQICLALSGFMLFLIFFYAIYLVKDIRGEDWVNENQRLLDFFENVCNVISGAMVFLAFKVLFDVTLDEKNRPEIYYKGTMLFSLTYIVLYAVYLVGFHPTNPTDIKTGGNIFRLICGSFNGLAMGLLFGRFTTMEYFFKDINLNTSRFTRRFYYYGTIFILPLYVLAQPMFGLFNVTEMGNHNIFGDPDIFRASIFIICFIGKSFFLVMFYTYINTRWFHYYLHFTLASHALPPDIIGGMEG